MFTPSTKKKSNYSSFKDRNVGHQMTPSFDFSPTTPVADNHASINDDVSIHFRPKTGTPAPWASRLSVLARIAPAKKSEHLNNRDPPEPVYVGEFPQAVHAEQTNILRKCVPGEACIAGGLDKETALSWMICGKKLFVWNYLSPAASKRCVILDLPSDIFGSTSRKPYLGDTWLLCVINWDSAHHSSSMVKQLTSAGVVLCNQKSRAVVYWPDIFSDEEASFVISLASPEELGTNSSMEHSKGSLSQLHAGSRHDTLSAEPRSFNSLIASTIPFNHHACVALATSSNGELWQFICSPAGILRQNRHDVVTSFSSRSQMPGNNRYPRSLIWRFPSIPKGESDRQFFLLTDHEIQCFSVNLSPNPTLSKIWSHEIIGTDDDFGIKKDLVGQKRIWPLDIQIDEHGKELTILVAIFYKDRLSSSNYTQYSLLALQYKSGIDESSMVTHGEVLEKKSPIQVVIPKARVEEEDFLFSMRLRIGGKPSGSAVIISGDGTATVSYFWRNSTKLYRFDLPYDAGKVVDASVFPASDDREEGVWVVLTEKAGVWAIPEKAVLFGGVEPQEGSSNERSFAEKKNVLITASVSPDKSDLDVQDMYGKQRAGSTGAAGRNAQDEEADALLNRLFNDFLLSGQVDGSLEKLKSVGAFERDGETNAFARASKSIVDSLAKHWTTTRSAEIVSLAVVTTQLMEKLQKHDKYLLFLALSKCHDELCTRQRRTLQIILEDGEKLTGMIQLRELQNLISQNRSIGMNSQHSGANGEASGSLWDLIQIVGERARRNAVLLMDRDNAEVFYSKISNLEEIFYCLEKHLDYIINVGQPFKVQVQRVCELSKECVTLLRSAMQYKNEHHVWYPPPDGLVPWYSQPVVRDGLWSVASFMIKILDDTSGIDLSSKSDICSHLEVLADVVLEAYVGAITAKIERGEEHKGLSDEYWRKRDALFDSLYQQIKGFVNVRCQDSDEKEQKELVLRELSSNLLSVARRHEAYRTLWNICCDLNDSTLLKELMHESMGLRGGFSYYVFEQLYKNEQFPKLLRLGEEFPQELMIFLKDHSNLLWLHEVFLHHYSSASKTLHALAISADERLFSAEETNMESRKTDLTLLERKRLLHLSKIASAAGKDANYGAELKRIDADLKILRAQEDILKLLPNDIEKQQIGHQLLPPWNLIRLCLKGQTPELLLKAFDVFAWTSSSFWKSNKSLLEECWRSAVDQDDWEKLYQFSIAEGWSDEDTMRVLRKTMLFQAASKCYGPESDTYEGSFIEVLPLKEEMSEVPSMKDFGSVEGILMQHKDYAEAGKLMLTALMLGAQVDDEESNGPIPMD
ncbi:nuclear pore complex protein NUP133 isoform X1 [Amaranthus tricolor]|uniref:nuclear pore complex protein NUP133 isoform X1 n=1 Tax=Amaranthus tricolor TaxID=29722 RepID=UPI0025851961|nr:nuclear pore complex protein NUP133 isoform X1 [Amaranthus tricolor]